MSVVDSGGPSFHDTVGEPHLQETQNKYQPTSGYIFPTNQWLP